MSEDIEARPLSSLLQHLQLDSSSLLPPFPSRTSRCSCAPLVTLGSPAARCSVSMWICVRCLAAPQCLSMWASPPPAMQARRACLSLIGRSRDQHQHSHQQHGFFSGVFNRWEQSLHCLFLGCLLAPAMSCAWRSTQF